MNKLIQRLIGKSSKIGIVKYAQVEPDRTTEYWRNYPATDGRIKGCLVKLGEEIFVVDTDKSRKRLYRTFSEYEEWAGTGIIIEAKIEVEPELRWETIETSNQGEYDVVGWAYELFVRSIANGELYRFPSPEQVGKFTGDCRCIMCMGNVVEQSEIDV